MRALHFHRGLFVAVCLLGSAAPGCNRDAESSAARSADETKSVVKKDVKEVGKATEKAAKDLGQATVELADKAGQHLENATNKAATGSQDAWITTKVKSALTAEGLDILHVHVDTDAKVVTLSGTVDSAARKAKAVSVARGVADVASVNDHLFVKPN